MKQLRTIAMAVGLLWAFSAAEMPEFVEHVIYKPLGGGKTGYGDFNNDGKLDVTAGPAGRAVYWFENPGDWSKEWTRHEIDPKNGGCVGGEPADVDGDSLVDYVSHGIWYRNSKETPGEKFEKFTFHNGGLPGKAGGCHDFIVADINLDGKPDAMNHGVSWWENPGGEDATKIWQEHVVIKNSGYWGGIAPHGFGDIDGDGDNDVAGIGNWFKNVDGSGKTWEKIQFSDWAKGTENRTWVADLDGDGDQDIAQAEGDGKDGRAAWHQNLDGKGGEWKTTDLPGIRGDLHSVGALDFDNDGDNDVFTGQNGGGTENEWVIFENTDGKGTFERRVIYKGYGAHESVYADFDADGDLDIFSKCWCGGGAGVILENKLDPVIVDSPSIEKALKDRLAFSARIEGAGRAARLLVSSQAPGPNTLELFDLQGNKLLALENEGPTDNSVLLQDLKKGVTIVRLNTPKGAITQKILF